jgi:hypothetical protein
MNVRDSDVLACVRGQRKLNQVLDAFWLLDFTMFRPVLAWRVFWKLWTVYFFDLPFFFRAAINRGYWISAYSGPYRARAIPQPCRSESNFSRPRHNVAWAWHSMCELVSAVQRRSVGDLPAFGFFRLPYGVPRRLLSEAYQSVKL